MSKIILISDLHILNRIPEGRLDETPETCMEKFEFLLNYAYENNAVIVQAGDFFDVPRNWYSYVFVLKMLIKHPVITNVIFGQHDSYMGGVREFTALGALIKSGKANLLGKEPLSFGDFHLYGVDFSYKQIIPEVKDPTKFNILSIHAPIAEKALYQNQKFLDAKKFLNKHLQFDAILCGDIHRSFFIVDNARQRAIVNTGPMIRKEATEYNFTHKPHFFVVDSEDNFAFTQVEIPHLSAESVLTRDHIETKDSEDGMLQEFVEAINKEEVPSMKGVDLIKNIQEFMKANKIDKGIQDILSETMSETEG